MSISVGFCAQLVAFSETHDCPPPFAFVRRAGNFSLLPYLDFGGFVAVAFGGFLSFYLRRFQPFPPQEHISIDAL